MTLWRKSTVSLRLLATLPASLPPIREVSSGVPFLSRPVFVPFSGELPSPGAGDRFYASRIKDSRSSPREFPLWHSFIPFLFPLTILEKLLLHPSLGAAGFCHACGSIPVDFFRLMRFFPFLTTCKTLASSPLRSTFLKFPEVQTLRAISTYPKPPFPPSPETPPTPHGRTVPYLALREPSLHPP